MTVAIEPNTGLVQLKPGVYEEMPFETYKRVDAVNASFLKKVAQLSPAHAEWERRNPSAATPPKMFGTAWHHAIFQPELFETTYTIAGECTAVLQSGNRKGMACGNEGLVMEAGGAWRCGVHGKGLVLPVGTSVLSAENDAKIRGMRAMLMNNSAARGRLCGLEKAKCETVIVWEDASGVLCKARLDQWGVYDGGWAINDGKTCGQEGGASPAGFGRVIADFYYHLQAAFYCDGLSIALGGEVVENFGFLAQETTAPFVSGVYKLHQEDITLGRNTYRSCLTTYITCKKAGVWPGYIDGSVETIHVPRWFFEQESRR